MQATALSSLFPRSTLILSLSNEMDQVAKDNQRFGWTSKNEILNGRHVMGGIFVGLLTEYSTGVNFIDQLKLTVSLLGIADIYD